MQIPQNLLKDKKIAIAVSGSIAIYKTLELIRLFIKAGASVRVVMSESSKKFITPLSFEALSQNRVLDDTNESWASDHNHIGLAKWADLLAIAPCSANTIAKLANAIADNLLTQVALAFRGHKIVAPSANSAMLENPITKANLKMLSIANYTILDTQHKLLACGDEGNGAMAESIEIFWQSARSLLQDSFWKDRRVVVTGGGTIEKIDEVRCITNFSSGKMASSLAAALYLRGADVNLVATKFESNLPESIHTIDVTSSAEMMSYLVDSLRVAKKGKLSKASLIDQESIKFIQKKPYLFMAAAVSDYIPKHPQAMKLKKAQIGREWKLELVENIDILSNINKDGLVTIAFKAEMDNKIALESAKELLSKKGVDGVCLNLLKSSSSFGLETNKIDFITKDGVIDGIEDQKLNVALEILSYAKELDSE